MYLKHLQVTVAFTFFTIAMWAMIPVALITGHSKDYKLSDVIDLYKEIANDIYGA